MPSDVQPTRRDLPVIVGHNWQHIMAKAEIFRTPEGMMIQITGQGEDAQHLAEYLEQAEPIALTFIAIPALTPREKRDT